MHLIDWIILVSTLLSIVIYGTIKTRGAKSSLDYIKAGNQAKWWTIWLSVMATQASAITFLSRWHGVHTILFWNSISNYNCLYGIYPYIS